MNQPLQRIRVGVAVLMSVLLAAVVGYHYIGGRDWVDAFYMVAITVSTVGFGERSQLSSGEKLFTIGVIVFGISAAAYALGGLLQKMTEGEIERVLGLRRMTNEIERLKGHVIICGYGRIGQILATELSHRKKPLVVVDNSAERISDATSAGYLAINGDATEEDVLIGVGVERARSLVTALASDADNVFITLTSRNLNPDVQIIARGEYPSTRKKLLQAGANRVVLPAAIGALRMAAMITRPSTVELIDQVSGQNGAELSMEEFLLAPGSTLAGKTVQRIDARRRHGLLVVAVKRADGKLIFSPDETLPFRAGDTLIVMGRMEDIEKFCQEFSL